MYHRASVRMFFMGLGAAIALARVAYADPPPQNSDTSAGDESEDVRSISIDSYEVQRGLRPRVEAAAEVRTLMENSPPDLEFAAPITRKSAVTGTVEVPVIPLLFANTSKVPYATSDLQTELFDGPWPTGTMTEDYREMSGDQFTVTGEVLAWTKVSKNDVFYAGPAPCRGRCNNAHIGDMLTEALKGVDATTDFRRFDNDGPDGKPDSGDDDGFVDFVAFVQPESGGECERNDNIWSQRYSLKKWTRTNFETNDKGTRGVNILVDEYVIMPALACDQKTMIQIGVFSHEFGHAFGLPDLYDAHNPVDSVGVGGWDLMATGSWGGMDKTPETPSHMSAWAKEYLGWVTPRVIETDETGVTLNPVQTGDAVRVEYSDAADPADKKYLLLEYRTQQGFDKSIAKSGLLVTEVNNVRVEGGLKDNSVNDLPRDMGINVIEADGKRQLDQAKIDNRGDAGDVFPGEGNVKAVDSTHAEHISAALCNIVQTPQKITLDIYVSRTTCPGALPQAVALSPLDAVNEKLRGEEVVIEGVLTNQGSNYFTDRKLVVTGQGGAASGGEVVVTLPAPLEVEEPLGASPADGTGDSRSLEDPDTLADLLNKKVILRGKLEKQVQQGMGLTDVFVVEEVQPAE